MNSAAARPRVCVLGLGYIGLPTAALLASRGHQVAGVDVNPDVVGTVNRGEVHISEPDLAALVRVAVESGRLRAHDAPQPADVFMICVPTPFHPGTDPPEPNLDYVRSAARSIAPVLHPGNLVIVESTCPVGATEEVAALLREAGAPDGVHVAHAPERVLPGRILAELTENDRIVGGVTPEASERAAAFYRGFVQGAVLTTDARTAEMVKLVENSFRDVNIAFANEVSMLAERLGIDAWELIRLANRHPRVSILQPGPGVGGHCIAVDPWFIVAQNPTLARLIRSAREVNDAKTEWTVAQIRAEAGRLAEREGIRGRPVRIAALGLAYKPNTDDLRESPALAVARGLQRAGFEVLASEPHLASHAEFELHAPAEAVARADLVVLLVAHRQFAGLDLGGCPVLDFCGALQPAPR
ncbi:MAG TPA: UDP-N-acetyl-D-mannosamine dehydrogenase [candidate division Zixibacteria bacterium]|nr:UDP-N-acetyl-D-mannosamine dehydrogenase [candidate division Zixibacteria bacterium]